MYTSKSPAFWQWVFEVRPFECSLLRNHATRKAKNGSLCAAVTDDRKLHRMTSLCVAACTVFNVPASSRNPQGSTRVPGRICDYPSGHNPVGQMLNGCATDALGRRTLLVPINCCAAGARSVKSRRLRPRRMQDLAGLGTARAGVNGDAPLHRNRWTAEEPKRPSAIRRPAAPLQSSTPVTAVDRPDWISPDYTRPSSDRTTKAGRPLF